MKPTIQTLGQILYSPSQYIIPVFQRNYRWERPQWQKLWDSLTEIGQPSKRGNHFMGFLVFVPGLPQPGHHTAFHLIDGQQRLTTLSLLLAAIRNVARENGQSDFADEVHGYYLVHPLKKGEHHYRLLPKERDHDTYIGIVDSKGDLNGRMVEALAYFESQLSAKAAEGETALRSVFDTICQRLEFMCATLETENAYNIFKSLNSTGVPLSASDLIRNFIFMHVEPDAQDEFDRDFWTPLERRFANADSSLQEDRFSQFFRDFLMSDGRYIAPKEIFNEFDARYEATDFSPKQLASDLLRASGQYEIICGKRNDDSHEVTEALEGLNTLESSTTYPLLLAMFSLREKNALDSAALARGIQMLRGFILRRFICNESSRGYGRMFVRALADEESTPLNALEEYLLERGWPDDTKFEAAFVQFPLYKRGYTKEIIETLERARGHKEPADLTDAQVEHVLPQTLNEGWREDLGSDADKIQATWLDSPGNLTLSAYNQELWNHKFSIKRTRYADSNIVLTREITAHGQWTAAEIEARGQMLARAAAKIWIGPDKPPAPAEAPHDEDGLGDKTRFEIRTRFWEGLSDFLQNERPNLPSFDVRPSPTLRLPSDVRHIGIEARFSLRNAVVGIDIWFWREESMPLWHKIQTDPTKYSAGLSGTWGFEQIKDKPRARMLIELPTSNLRSPESWPAAYDWFAANLSAIYEHLFPRLKADADKSGAND